VLNAHHRLDLDVGFLMAGEADVWKDQKCLRAIGEVEVAIEAKRLDPALLAAGFIQGVAEGDGFVVYLVGKMRRQYSHGEGNRRLDLHAEFLGIVIGSHQTVDFGRGRHIVFFLHNAAPMKFGLNAIVHTSPAVVLDVQIIGRNELPDAGPEDGADGGHHGLLGLALVSESNNHGPLGGKMALVNRAGEMLLDAEQVEIRGGLRMLHGVIPFVRPGHCDSDRICSRDTDVQVSTSCCGMVDATGVPACGLHGDSLGVGRSPVENPVLRARQRGKRAEQERGKDGEGPHKNKYLTGKSAYVANSRGMNYESTTSPRTTRDWPRGPCCMFNDHACVGYSRKLNPVFLKSMPARLTMGSCPDRSEASRILRDKPWRFWKHTHAGLA